MKFMGLQVLSSTFFFFFFFHFSCIVPTFGSRVVLIVFVFQICSASSSSHEATGLVGPEHGAEVQCGSGQRSCGVFPIPAAAVELLAVWESLHTGVLPCSALFSFVLFGLCCLCGSVVSTLKKMSLYCGSNICY